jgi:hypothetical protein
MELATGISASLCAVVLMVAGFLKIRDRSTFASQIAAYDVVPTRVSYHLGHVLPFAEILAALLVLFASRVGGPIAALLFTGFAVAMGKNVLRGRTELICGCFGPRGKQSVSGMHVVMNFGLAGAAVFAAFRTGPPSLTSLRTGISIFALAYLWTVYRELHSANQRLRA